MRTFSAGSGRVQGLAFTPDSCGLVLDLRGELRAHPWLGIPIRPAWEIAWWEASSGTALHRFRLRDSLYGPGGFQSSLDDEQRQDSAPEEPAFDVSFRVVPLRVAVVWEWTNKEDGVCVFDVDRREVVDFRAPYKTHTEKLRLSPDGSKLAAATVNDMDGSALFEIWGLTAAMGARPAEAGNGPGQWWHRAMRERKLAIQRGCASALGPLTDLAFDGRFGAATGSARSVLLVWDSATAPGAETVSAALRAAAKPTDNISECPYMCPAP
jgi:hypothetical protein